MAVAVNAYCCVVGTWFGRNSRTRWEEVLHWAHSLANEYQWGVETPGMMGVLWRSSWLRTLKPVTPDDESAILDVLVTESEDTIGSLVRILGLGLCFSSDVQVTAFERSLH